MRNLQSSIGLLNTTEKWCRDRNVYLALVESIELIDGQHKDKTADSIPSILSDFLAVSFDNHVGHDYLQDYLERYELYNKKESRIEFDLEYFNKITKGGLPNKTLNINFCWNWCRKVFVYVSRYGLEFYFRVRTYLYITMEMK